MKKMVKGILYVVLSAVVFAAGYAAAAGKAKKDVVMQAADMKFAEVVPGVSKVVLWGNPDKGAYGTLTKFNAGTKLPLHSHSSEINLVIVSGTLLHGTAAGEVKLGPGSYLRQSAGTVHTTGCDAGADCVFVETSKGKFDLKTADEAKK